MPLVTTLTHTNGLSRGLDLKVGAGLKVFRVKKPTRLNRIWKTRILEMEKYCDLRPHIWRHMYLWKGKKTEKSKSNNYYRHCGSIRRPRVKTVKWVLSKSVDKQLQCQWLPVDYFHHCFCFTQEVIRLFYKIEYWHTPESLGPPCEKENPRKKTKTLDSVFHIAS